MSLRGEKSKSVKSSWNSRNSSSSSNNNSRQGGLGPCRKKRDNWKGMAQMQENSEIIWDSGCNLVEFKLCGFGTCKDHSSFGWSKHILSCRDLRRLSIINSWWCSSRCWCNKQRWYSHFGLIGQHLGWEVFLVKFDDVLFRILEFTTVQWQHFKSCGLYPLVIQHSYWKWQSIVTMIVSFPIKNDGFP